jgi:Icc-related predicted phosphoesterase
MKPKYLSPATRKSAPARERAGGSGPTSIIQLESGASTESVSILACSDLRTQNVEDLIDYVKRHDLHPDVIVYAGDDVARFRDNAGKNDFERLAALSRYGLVAVIGNDDGPSAFRHITGEKVYDAHRVTVLIGNVAIIGQEGAPANNECLPIGDPLYSEPQISRHLRDRAARLGPSDQIVVVSHAPPHDVLDHSIRHSDSHIGSKALSAFVRCDQRVQLVICGHSHLNGGKWDRLDQAVVMNVASHDGEKDPIRVGLYELRRRNAVEAFTPPPLFWEVTRYDELSRINGIYAQHCEALVDSGIVTIAQLAEASPDHIATIIGWSPRAAARYHHLARARHLRAPVAMAPLICPPYSRAIFDIETDPYGGNQLCWCIGVLDEASGEFLQFVATREKYERRMLAEFLDWCAGARPERLVAYSGSDFDRRNLICRLRAHQLPVPPALEASIDLLEPIRKALAVPISNYQLKPVAEVLGFSFRHTDLDGFEVASLALKAMRAGQQIPKELLEYNEDDVRSTAHVLAEVERICGYAEPTKRAAGRCLRMPHDWSPRKRIPARMLS